MARVLKFAKPFHVDGDFAAECKNGRGIGLRGGDGRRHVAKTRPADSEHGAEMAARAGVAIGHISGATLMRGDDGLQLRFPRQGRKKRIDQPARHQEQMS